MTNSYWILGWGTGKDVNTLSRGTLLPFAQAIMQQRCQAVVGLFGSTQIWGPPCGCLVVCLGEIKAQIL